MKRDPITWAHLSRAELLDVGAAALLLVAVGVLLGLSLCMGNH